MNNLFNVESENAVLSIIMTQPDSIFSVESLKPFMFSSTPNALIFSTMQELSKQNYLPDYSLLIANLTSAGKINEAGGVEYIKSLGATVYPKENLDEYTRQVIDSYRARSLISASVAMKSKIEGGGDVAEILSDLRSNIDNLETTSGGEQVVDFNSASQDMWKVLVSRVENPGIRGITTGFPQIDIEIGGYSPGDLWIIAGRPSMGKTADLCNSALAVAESGNPVLIFSLEMNKVALAERMISIRSGVPLADIRLGTLNKEQLELISNTIKQIKDLPIYIDSNFDADESYYSVTTRKYKNLKDIKVTFFDYIQLASRREANQTAEIGSFSRTAKLLANELGITSVVFSQLNRGVEMREDKRPVLSDLRQSGNLEEDADIVMFLYRDEYYYPETSKQKGTLEKIFRKNRNGPTGTLFYNFNQQNLKIVEEKRK